MSLNKEAILAASDAAIETVDVPEWGGQVCVRSLTGAQRDAFEKRVVGQRDKAGNVDTTGLRSLMCALCICDEAGNPLFVEADIPQLETRSAAALQRVFDAASALNGMGGDSIEAARSDFTVAES
jgi:hypothetical protein